MKRVLVTFWTSLVSLAGVVGLFWAAQQLHLIFQFWLIVGLAVLLAIGRWTLPGAREWLRHARAYRGLLRAIGERDQKISGLEQDLSAALDHGPEEFKRGLEEGQRRVLGSFLAFRKEPPEIIGIVEYDGGVALLAKDTDPPLPDGARFSVVVAHTGQPRGAVEVVAAAGLEGTAVLRCVEPTNERFWQALEERAAYDNSPPAGTALAIYTLGDTQRGVPSSAVVEEAPEASERTP